MSVQSSNNQRLHASITANEVGIVNHGLARLRPQDPANLYYFSKGKEGIFDSVIRDHEDHVVFHFANNEEVKETSVYDAKDEVVAIIDWNIRAQPVLKYDGDEVNMKKWLSRKSGNTAIMNHKGQMYEWIQEQFYAMVRSSPQAERKAIIFNDQDPPAIEMLPEGLRDNLLLSIILLTAFAECGLIKGHGFPASGSGEDNNHGRVMESFLGVGTRLKNMFHGKREGKDIDTNNADEHPAPISPGATPADE